MTIILTSDSFPFLVTTTFFPSPGISFPFYSIPLRWTYFHSCVILLAPYLANAFRIQSFLPRKLKISIAKNRAWKIRNLRHKSQGNRTRSQCLETIDSIQVHQVIDKEISVTKIIFQDWMIFQLSWPPLKSLKIRLRIRKTKIFKTSKKDNLLDKAGFARTEASSA